MKKFFVWAVLCALLLSLGAVSAAAGYPDGSVGTPGVFSGENSADFFPVGEVRIQWDEDVAEQVDMTDGDISDWLALGLTPTVITADNMVSWVGGAEGVRDPGMPAEWKITAYYVADPDYVYMIYDITDSDFAYGATANGYDGDALQIAIDFGGLLTEAVEKNPDSVPNHGDIFYSFSCLEDGAPLSIMRQESDQDGLLSEENGDGVKGAARKTDKGWSVEMALSWDRMYDDYVWRAWVDDPRIYFGGIEARPLKINATLYYLNRTETAGEITWAAGTTNGTVIDENGTPGVSWTVYDNGAKLVLPWEEGLYLNCDGLVELTICQTALSQTEPPYDPPAETEIIIPDISVDTDCVYQTIAPDGEGNYGELVTVYETVHVSFEATDDGEALDEKMNAILQKYGCSAVAGAGTLTALLALAAVAYTFRKKD